jgi:hypothetical protein
MQSMAKVLPKALEQLKQDLKEAGDEGKAFRLVFQGFG